MHDKAAASAGGCHEHLECARTDLFPASRIQAFDIGSALETPSFNLFLCGKLIPVVKAAFLPSGNLAKIVVYIADCFDELVQGGVGVAGVWITTGRSAASEMEKVHKFERNTGRLVVGSG